MYKYEITKKFNTISNRKCFRKLKVEKNLNNVATYLKNPQNKMSKVN